MTVRLVGRLVDFSDGVPPTDPVGSVARDPDEVRETACRLVESRSVCTPPSAPSSVAPRSPSAADGGPLLGILLWGLLIVVLIAIAVLAYRSLRERMGSRDRDNGLDDDSDDDRNDDPDADSLIGSVAIDHSREPSGWREEAEQHRAAGRFHDALRCRYRALVGDLARRGLLDEIAGRTTGEERRQLQNRAPTKAAPFAEAADLFDGAWYGGMPVERADDDRFQQLDREVLASGSVLAGASASTHRAPPRDEGGAA